MVKFELLLTATILLLVYGTKTVKSSLTVLLCYFLKLSLPDEYDMNLFISTNPFLSDFFQALLHVNMGVWRTYTSIKNYTSRILNFNSGCAV